MLGHVRPKIGPDPVLIRSRVKKLGMNLNSLTYKDLNLIINESEQPENRKVIYVHSFTVHTMGHVSSAH